MKRVNTQQNGRGNGLVILLVAVVFILLNIIIARSSIFGKVNVEHGPSWQANQDDHLKEEADVLEKIRLGKKITERVSLSYALPNLDVFSNKDLFASEFSLLKPTRDQKALGPAWQNSLDSARLLPEFYEYCSDQIAQCREVVTGLTRPLPGDEQQRLKSADELAQKLYTGITQTYLNRNAHAHRYIGTPSIFTSATALQGNNGRLRVRLAVTYTDLALMSHLYRQGLVDNQDPKHTAYGVAGAAQLTPSMYTAYRICHKVVEKTREEVSRKLPGGTDAEKEYATALMLHDYLCLNIEYSGAAAAVNNQLMTTHAILRKKSSSQGYARAYRLLLTMAGIKNAYVYGSIRYTDAATGKVQQTPRCWNMVCIGEKWYHVDVAADDPLTGEQAPFSHACFGIPESLLKTSHQISAIYDEQDVLNRDIQAADNGWYFDYKGLRAATPRELAERIVMRALAGELELEVLYGGAELSQSALNTAIRDYLEENKLRFEQDYTLSMDQQVLEGANLSVVRTAFIESAIK